MASKNPGVYLKRAVQKITPPLRIQTPIYVKRENIKTAPPVRKTTTRKGR